MGRFKDVAQLCKKALILFPGSSCCHCLAAGCNSLGKRIFIVLYHAPKIANSAAAGS